MESGIYCYRNTLNNKAYVGQSYNVEGRIKTHNYRLLKGYDDCTMLQLAVKKYGLDKFDISILEYCPSESLDEREGYWINKTNALHPNGYNLKEAGSYGKHSEFIKKQISNSLMGEKNPFFGKHHTEETKRAMGEKKRGKKIKSNRRKRGRSSKYIGVVSVHHGEYHYWQAQIYLNFKSIYIGTSKYEEIAAKKYDDYVLKNNIQAPLNFPSAIGGF